MAKKAPRNRILQLTLMYDAVKSRFYMKYNDHLSRLARAMASPPPVITTDAPYVEAATTGAVLYALGEKNWDYINFTERDNIVPDDWAEVIANELDPDVHKFVGRWYFGKVQEDQRSICGYVRPNGDFDRFTYNEVRFFHEHPGLYRVGAGMPGVDDSSLTFTVGLGCTAIHRSVFENWSGEMPWFKSNIGWDARPTKEHPNGHMTMLGHDVRLCLEAHKQGIDVWIDTRKASGHIGDYVSNEVTYLASAELQLREGAVDREALAGMRDPKKMDANPMTAMSDAELKALGAAANGKTVLEIGSRYGASTIAMATQGAERIYALDWHRGDVWHGEPDGTGDTLEIFWRYCLKYKIRDRVVPLVGKSDQVLPLLPSHHFGLVLVDGDHSYAGAKYDLEQALRLVALDGTIAVHDFEREKEFNYPEDSPLQLGVTRAAREVLGEPDELHDTVALYHLKRPALSVVS